MKSVKGKGKMYRCRENYLRFGQTHIFLNFTEENLKDLAVINAMYGKGVRINKSVKNSTKKITYSGEIHIFLDSVDPRWVVKMNTFEALRQVKVLYGDIFKIYLHLYEPIVCNNKKSLVISSPYRDDIKLLMNTRGNMRIMKHRIDHKMIFELGFTRITIQKNLDVERLFGVAGVKPMDKYGRLEITTTLMTNTGRNSTRHYEPYQIGAVWSHSHKLENIDFKTTATIN